MDEDNLTRLALDAGLRELGSKKYFDICHFNKLAQLAGAHCAGSKAYLILSNLHCIAYGKMDAELKVALPELVAACLGQQAPQFRLGKPNAPDPRWSVQIVDVAPEPKKTGLLAWLS